MDRLEKDAKYQSMQLTSEDMNKLAFRDINQEKFAHLQIQKKKMIQEQMIKYQD